MKKFFEEYGFVLIAVIVVVALILLVKNVGSSSIKDRTDSWLQSLTKNKLESGAPITHEIHLTYVLLRITIKTNEVAICL